jgi:hypothetical protein
MIHADFAIGLDATHIYKLSDLDLYVDYGTAVTRPHWAFQDGAGVVKLDNGSSRIIGLPQAQWRWDVITDEERMSLRLFCPYPEVSAQVYISTYTNEDVENVSTFQAMMHWPADKGEDVKATKRRDFVISFDNLVEI